MPIFKGLVPGKDSQVFVLTTLENPPIYIFLKWNNVSLKRRPDAFKPNRSDSSLKTVVGCP